MILLPTRSASEALPFSRTGRVAPRRWVPSLERFSGARSRHAPRAVRQQHTHRGPDSGRRAERACFERARADRTPRVGKRQRPSHGRQTNPRGPGGSRQVLPTRPARSKQSQRGLREPGAVPSTPPRGTNRTGLVVVSDSVFERSLLSFYLVRDGCFGYETRAADGREVEIRIDFD